MNDKQAFLNAIQANPYDVAIIGAFADWLAENPSDENQILECVYRASMVPGHHTYYPEMGETRPFGHIKANMGHAGPHWYIRTPLELKGRGIKFIDASEHMAQLTQASPSITVFRYKVTQAAFAKLCKQYAVYSECLL